jgi:L-lactate dehydrogenase complex protein LldG
VNESPRLSAREEILAAVRGALPKPAVELPDVPAGSHEHSPTGGVGYHGDLTALEEVEGFSGPGESPVPYFARQLTAMGGRSFVVADSAAAQAKLSELFPDARTICSAVKEISGTRQIEKGDDPHGLADVDVAVLRSPLGVAEAGAIWLSDADLVVPSLGVLAQHLVVLLDPEDIVPTLHEAYSGRIDLAENAYGVFMAGPSATGDIEGVIIHGAQGPRSMTVLLLPR